MIIMFGFVKSGKDIRRLGGEIFQEKKRNMNIAFWLLGIVTFLILNFILYSLTKV